MQRSIVPGGMAHVSSMTVAAECISWYCVLLIVLMLVLSCCDSQKSESGDVAMDRVRNQAMNRLCNEIYIVREGETLQTISEKCSDPYIIEENPHIHDPDDVFPGLVIKINPFHRR